MDKVQSLKAIRRLSRITEDSIIDTKTLARYLKKPETACITMLIRLSNLGIVNYNILLFSLPRYLFSY